MENAIITQAIANDITEATKAIGGATQKIKASADRAFANGLRTAHLRTDDGKRNDGKPEYQAVLYAIRDGMADAELLRKTGPERKALSAEQREQIRVATRLLSTAMGNFIGYIAKLDPVEQAKAKAKQAEAQAKAKATNEAKEQAKAETDHEAILKFITASIERAQSAENPMFDVTALVKELRAVQDNLGKQVKAGIEAKAKADKAKANKAKANKAKANKAKAKGQSIGAALGA
jgi:uncharacterized protein (DUF849 family)